MGVTFNPVIFPLSDDSKVQDLIVSLQEMQANIANAMLVSGDADISYVEPSRPQNGMIRYADGTEWDPGSGAGFYGYEEGAWVKLGQPDTFSGDVNLPETTTEPTTPIEGMLRFADGTSWNPGDGRGVYAYEDGSWVKLYLDTWT